MRYLKGRRSRRRGRGRGERKRKKKKEEEVASGARKLRKFTIYKNSHIVLTASQIGGKLHFMN